MHDNDDRDEFESPQKVARRLGLKLPKRDRSNQFICWEALVDPAGEAYWRNRPDPRPVTTLDAA